MKQAVAGLCLATVALLAWYLNSERFQERVRLTVIAKLQMVTGGEVQLKALSWSLARLEVEGSGLTVRGLESASEVPFLHADHFFLRFKVLSLFGGRVGLQYLSVERPQVHIVINPAGKTTQPSTISGASPYAPIRNLFDLGADRVELTNGELVWNNRRIPLNVIADDVAATIERQGASSRVAGSVTVGKLDTEMENLRPFSSSAKVEFSADRGEWVISSLRLQSGASQLNATARVTDPQNLAMEMHYDLRLDMAELAAITRNRDLRAGGIEIQGAAVFNPKSLTANGSVMLMNAAWQSSSTRVSGVNAKAAFTIRDDDLALPRISGNWQGAVFTGNVLMHGWAPKLLPLMARSKERSGTGQLHVSGLRLEQGASAIFGNLLPLERVRLAGIASGDAQLSWGGSLNSLRTKVMAHIAPPVQPPAASIPLRGSIAATAIWPSRLEVEHLDLQTATSELSASGTLGAGKSNLAVNLRSSEVGEIGEMFAAMQAAPLPLEAKGAGRFVGQVTGTLAEPTIAGHLELSNIDSTLKRSTLLQKQPFKTWFQWAAGDLSKAQTVHWDNFTADVILGPDQFSIQNAALTRGAAGADFSARTRLTNYELQPDSTIAANVSARNASILDLEHFVGSDYRASGTSSFHLQLGGSVANPKGEGSASILEGSVAGQEFRSMAGTVNLTGHEAQFSDFKLNFAQAQIAGQGSYDWSTRGFRVSLDGSGFNLSRVAWLQRPRFSVLGQATLHVEGSGTVAEPRINATVNLRNLVLNGESAGDMAAQAVTQGANLHLTVQSNFIRAKMLGSGNVYLRGDWPTQFTLNFSRLDIDPLLTAFVAGRVTEHSAVDGSVYVHGPLRKPRELEVEGVLQQARINVENFAVQSAEPIRFSVKQQTLNLAALHIVGEGTDFAASGHIPFEGGTSAAGLNANGRLNLKILQSFNPDLASTGTAAMSVKVAGSLLAPSTTGRLQIEHASLALSDLPAGLNDVNGSMVFNEDRLRIEALTAHTGGGVLDLGGFISYTHGIYFNFTAQGSQIRLRYPAGVSSVADADLSFAGNFASSLLSGTITVTRFGLNPEFDFASYLANRQGPPVLTSAQSVLNNIHFDVHVVTTPELQVQMSLARVAGNADFRLRGTAAKPVVLGRVNILDGQVFFSGTSYRIDRGDVTFSNPVTITPVLDLEASAKVRDYDITLGLHGPIQKLSITYRSEPPLPTPDIIALIALGHTHQDEVLSTQPQTSAQLTDSNALLGQALNASVSSRVQQLFGVSRIKIDPQAGGPENNPNTRLTLEQQVSNRVILTYLTNLSQAAQQEVEVEVQLSRILSAVGLRDQNGVVSFSLRVRQRKK